MFNPMQILQMVQRGGNPQQIIMQAARQNPVLQQAMQMVNGKSPQQIRDMAYQIAAQRGVNLEQFAQQMGIRLPR